MHFHLKYCFIILLTHANNPEAWFESQEPRWACISSSSRWIGPYSSFIFTWTCYWWSWRPCNNFLKTEWLLFLFGLANLGFGQSASTWARCSSSFYRIVLEINHSRQPYWRLIFPTWCLNSSSVPPGMLMQLMQLTQLMYLTQLIQLTHVTHIM